MLIKKLSEGNYVWECNSNFSDHVFRNIYYSSSMKCLQKEELNVINNDSLTIATVVKNKDNDSIAVRFKIADPKLLVSEESYPYVWVEYGTDSNKLKFEDLTQDECETDNEEPIVEGNLGLKNKAAMKSNADHYANMQIEPFEVMQGLLTHPEYVGFLKGNIVKYSMRQGRKAGEPAEKDAAKCRAYIDKLHEATHPDIHY